MSLLLIKIIIFFIFLFMTAYFAGTETALTSLSTLNLKNIKNDYKKSHKYISFWERKPNELLATILVGTNLAVIGAGVLATSITLELSDKYYQYRTLIISCFPVIITILILAWGEIIPKIFSRYKAIQVAIFGLPFLIVFNKILKPLTKSLLRISERLIKLFGEQSTYEIPFLKPEELKILLLSDDTSPLSVSARRIINNILDFGKTRINHVMVPRDEIQAVDLKGEFKEIVGQLVDKGYSRIPVYRDNLDNIVGIIYSKDLNLALRRENLIIIEDLIRPAYFVPESARINQVLREFKRGRHHLAIVVDEYGSTTGIATIEDLVEEIVGEIWDEYDLQEKTIFPLPDGFYLIRANEPIDKVNEELKFNLPAEEFTTISGWILDLFGRIPKIGESIKWGNIELEIVDATKKRIVKIKIRKYKEGQ
ncbi:MAG: HlyC/CorC family transporter [Endomicrobiales bacterium]|nr:HlyC/CorC family transporter [Endomicrobiales bacterium]